MLQIGDKAYTLSRNIRVITSISESASDANELMYGLGEGPSIWREYELTLTGEHGDYPKAQFNIGDEVTVDGKAYRIEAIYLQSRDIRWVYRYRLKQPSGSYLPIARDEHEIIEQTNYTLF